MDDPEIFVTVNHMRGVTGPTGPTGPPSIGVRTTFSNANAVWPNTTHYLAQIGTLTATRTVTLPAANAFSAGTEIVIADESGSCAVATSITCVRAGADTINGATSISIAAAYGWRRFVTDGVSKWTFDGATLDAANAGEVIRDSIGTAIVQGGGIVITVNDGADTITISNPMQTLVDAKGDLIVGSANDTVVRVPVGANGLALVADSLQTSGTDGPQCRMHNRLAHREPGPNQMAR